MAVLVTGAYGFIGREVVNRLAMRGEEVVALGLAAETTFPFDSVHHVTGNVADAGDLERIFSDYPIDRVIHLAYQLDIWGDRPLDATEVNLTGFVRLLEACRLHQVRRLVWTSSVMVYGKPSEYADPVNEQSATNPNTFYGKCKEFNEYIARHYIEKFHVDAIGLRPTTVYGPGRYARGAASFLYDIVYAAVTGRPTVVEEGLARTDVVHVGDVAGACLLALDAARVDERVFNIGGFELSAEQLVRIAEEITGRPVPVTLLPKENNRFPSRIDCTLAKKVLGYEPRVSLMEGIRQYMDRFDPHAPLTR